MFVAVLRRFFVPIDKHANGAVSKVSTVVDKRKPTLALKSEAD
jgi:hypothetical protein